MPRSRPIPAPVTRPEPLIAPLRVGTDPGRWRRPRPGFSALHYAAEEGKHSWMRMMLGFGVDPNYGNFINDTALPAAYFRQHAGVVVVMIAAGADPTRDLGNLLASSERRIAQGGPLSRRTATIAAAFRVAATPNHPTQPGELQ